jgi:hypothetical protein
MKINFDEYDVSDEEVAEYNSISPEELKKRVPTFTSEKLCSIVVCNRYFGNFKDMAVSCMEELAKRRIAGDNFDFESYIDQSLAGLPKLDFSIPDLAEVLKTFTAGRVK